MHLRTVMGIGGIVIAAFTFGAFSVWLYQAGASYDAQGKPVTLKGKVMEQKDHAMEGLVSAVARGDYERATWILNGFDQSVITVEGYLDTDMYATAGRTFTETLEELRAALHERDWLRAKDATLALEASCLECHQQLLGRAGR